MLYSDERFCNSTFKKQSYHSLRSATTSDRYLADLQIFGSKLMSACYSVSGMG